MVQGQTAWQQQCWVRHEPVLPGDGHREGFQGRVPQGAATVPGVTGEALTPPLHWELGQDPSHLQVLKLLLLLLEHLELLQH